MTTEYESTPTVRKISCKSGANYYAHQTDITRSAYLPKEFTFHSKRWTYESEEIDDRGWLFATRFVNADNPNEHFTIFND